MDNRLHDTEKNKMTKIVNNPSFEKSILHRTIEDNKKFREILGKISPSTLKDAETYLKDSSDLNDPLYKNIRILRNAYVAEEWNKEARAKREYDMSKAKQALSNVQNDLHQRSIANGSPLETLHNELLGSETTNYMHYSTPERVDNILTQEEKLQELITEPSKLEDLPSDVKKILDKIKALNNFELGRSILSMSSSKSKYSKQLTELAGHFTHVKSLNGKLNMPGSDIRRIYHSKQVEDGIKSYQMIESQYTNSQLTETMKKHCLRSEFDFNQEEKPQEQITESPELEDLPSDVKKILDKIKALNNFELGRSIDRINHAKLEATKSRATEYSKESAELAGHFTHVKSLNGKLNMPGSDIRRIYHSEQAKDGIKSYQMIESQYTNSQLTETMKDHCLQSGFDFKDIPNGD